MFPCSLIDSLSWSGADAVISEKYSVSPFACALATFVSRHGVNSAAPGCRALRQDGHYDHRGKPCVLDGVQVGRQHKLVGLDALALRHMEFEGLSAKG